MKFYKSAAFLFGACVAAVIGGDWLLYGWPLGWNLALCVLAGLAVIALCNVPVVASREILLPAMAVLGLALGMCEQPTVIGTLLAVLGLGTLALAARGGMAPTLAAWIVRWLRLPVHFLLRPILDALIAAKWFFRHPKAEPAALRWAISGPSRWRWAACFWRSLRWPIPSSRSGPTRCGIKYARYFIAYRSGSSPARGSLDIPGNLHLRAVASAASQEISRPFARRPCRCRRLPNR